MHGAPSDDGDSFFSRPGFVFDTETTGVSVEEDRVVELGGVAYRNGQEVLQRRVRVNPGVPIPASASAVHGIYADQLVGKPSFGEVGERFVAYLDGRMHDGQTPWLAGYNAVCFDAPLLNAEFRRVGISVSIDPSLVVDPMVFVRWHLRHLRSRKLEAVCQHFGLAPGRSHSALDDAKATGQLLFRLIAEGMLPSSVSQALREQATIARILLAEWEDFSYWLYRDRHNGQLRLGAGTHIGSSLEEVSADYLRSLLAKVGDMPQNVRETFAQRAQVPRRVQPSAM